MEQTNSTAYLIFQTTLLLGLPQKNIQNILIFKDYSNPL